MKKYIFFVLAMVAALSLNAQQPLFFHNRTESLTYQIEHPSAFPSQKVADRGCAGNYTQKLDSVIGADDFDWTRWKNIYVYRDSVVEEISYLWQNQAWEPSVKTEAVGDQVKSYQWTEEGWEHYQTVTYQYMTCGENALLESMTTERLDSVWVSTNYTTYEYDDRCQPTGIVNYQGQNAEGEWIANSKWEYAYNENGALDTCVYSTIRNGNWREAQRDIFYYDENQQCTALLEQRKGGGWGPFGDNWMDSFRYEFEYEDGELVAEYLYYSSGWFGGDLTLDSKLEYVFDVNGNLQAKTGSVYNEVDWIVRDVYENRFDLNVDAATVLGLDQIWENTLNQGMGYAFGDALPLNNQWLSCSIASSYLDTEFTLYCSGFAAVEETQEETFKAYCNGDRLMVVSELPTDITVYDLLGRKVASKTQTQQCEFNLNPGLYLVSDGLRVTKVVVK